MPIVFSDLLLIRKIEVLLICYNREVGRVRDYTVTI